MSFYLVVKNAFETFVRGDLITDVKKIEQILESAAAHSVTKVLSSTSPKSES